MADAQINTTPSVHLKNVFSSIDNMDRLSVENDGASEVKRKKKHNSRNNRNNVKVSRKNRLRHQRKRRQNNAMIKIVTKPEEPVDDRRKRYLYLDKNGKFKYAYYPIADCCGYPTISCNYPINLKPISTPRPTYGPLSKSWKGLIYGKKRLRVPIL